jgi:hypothetical protein
MLKKKLQLSQRREITKKKYTGPHRRTGPTRPDLPPTTSFSLSPLPVVRRGCASIQFVCEERHKSSGGGGGREADTDGCRLRHRERCPAPRPQGTTTPSRREAELAATGGGTQPNSAGEWARWRWWRMRPRLRRRPWRRTGCGWKGGCT